MDRYYGQTVEHTILSMIQGLSSNHDPLEGMSDRRLEAREDFKAFCELMVPGYVDGWHITMLREVLERVERGELKRLIITMPPRHSKSLHVSENFPAWYLGRNPRKRVIAASHTQRLADIFSRRVRDKMQYPEWPFPETKIARGNTGVRSWSLEGIDGGGYYAVGVGGSPTGVGADLMVIDDPLRNQQDADSEVIRESIWEWFTGTMYTRRQPGAAIIVTATRWHEDDLTGRLLNEMSKGGEPWFELHLPAEFDDGSYLWPEFFADSEYKLARLSNDRVWNALYQGQPHAKEGNLLKREWFPYAPMGERYLAIVQCWDTAEKPGVTNDYSVCATIGISPTSYDIIDVWEGKPEFPELVQAAKDRHLWASSVFMGVPVTVCIEDKSSGTQLIQTLQRTTRIPVEPIQPEPGKDPKERRVIGMTPLVKSGRVRILSGMPWINRVLSQLASFPTGANDDIVDAIMIGLVYATGGMNAGSVKVTSYVNGHQQEEIGRLRRAPFTKTKLMEVGDGHGRGTY
jgi:predicted phage terminase large subunit-like protein